LAARVAISTQAGVAGPDGNFSLQRDKLPAESAIIDVKERFEGEKP
jgi:hypothetical protein